MAKVKRKPGPKSTFTDEIGDRICAEIARGRSLNDICKESGMPHEATVRGWVLDGSREGFVKKYNRARELQALKWAEEILTIADDGQNDTYEDDDGRTRVDRDHIHRSRLRVDTRKWLLSKVLPKVYGDRLTAELTGRDGGPIKTENTVLNASALSADKRAALRAILEAAKSEG